MQVISRRPFYSAETRYPNQRQALSDVYRILKQAHFESPDEMRKVFKSLDNFKYKSKWWVINISGNHLRLIAFIQFSQNRIYVKHIVNHADYDKLCQRYQRGEL
ncbi:MAG: type II toxin-antitoxin system HigB family toxin [Gammaproteobacteria bacterium]|jgi:mRNA interferase HigB